MDGRCAPVHLLLWGGRGAEQRPGGVDPRSWGEHRGEAGGCHHTHVVDTLPCPALPHHDSRRLTTTHQLLDSPTLHVLVPPLPLFFCRVPTAFTGYSFHVVEAVIVFFNEILVCFFLPIHARVHRYGY